jgi:pSer/pThr/pTyr-binding forkhead associated (FHA) protein
MSYENSSPMPDEPISEPTNFNRQTLLSLAEVLQICCVAFKTGQITFRSNESSGYVYLQHGKVLHAVCGTVEGEEAVYRMLAWPNGTFFLDEDILPHKKTIKLSWEQLLFEGARRVDDGGGIRDLLNSPVVTAEPVTSTRTKDSLPKLTLNLPDQRPLVYELQAEYTHVGRASGNEVPLAYPSVSNRHCIFVLSGPDVILRDLNSSNGTVVNGETISEVILRPGDVIQVGVVQIKFEPGVRRPKLTQSSPTAFGAGSEMTPSTGRAPVFSTVKLPTRAPAEPPVEEIKDDAAFVKGESAISYQKLPKPEVPSKGKPWVLIIVGTIVLLTVLCGGYYYFFLRPH